MNFDRFIETYGVWIYIGSVILAAILLTKIARNLIGRYLRRSSQTLHSDPTNFRFFKNSISVVIWVAASIVIIYRLPGGEGVAVSIFASAGLIAAIVGFAAQAAFANIISGIFIVIFKPFRVGDRIEVAEGRIGIVEDITLRHTVIRDLENKRIIIPNSTMSADTVLNHTISDEKICRHLEFGISYDSDVKLARKIIQEVAMAHKFQIDNRSPEELEAGKAEVDVKLVRFGDSSIVLRAYIWSSDPARAFEMSADLNESVKERFDNEGIEIPFPYRTIVYKKDIVK